LYTEYCQIVKKINCGGKYPFNTSKCEFSRNWRIDITLIEPISVKLTPAGQLFVKNSVNKFLENLTNGIVADNRQAADRWVDTVSKNKLFFTSQGMLKFMTYKNRRLNGKYELKITHCSSVASGFFWTLKISGKRVAT
jgi:hypothetical protein